MKIILLSWRWGFAAHRLFGYALVLCVFAFGMANSASAHAPLVKMPSVAVQAGERQSGGLTMGFADAVADSVADFSAVQGAKGWSYSAETDSSRKLKPLMFSKKACWQGNSPMWPTITKTRLTPVPGKAAVLRWQPAHAGSVRLVGVLRKPGAGRAACRVLVNGAERWKRDFDAADTIPHTFDILLYDLPKGATVDIAVGGSALDWKAQVLDEPCTAWNPSLPLGPQFTEAQKVLQRTQGSALLSALNALARGAAHSFSIPPGDYRFSGDGALYPHVKNLRDMTLSAAGVTFWFDPPQVHGLEFDDCRNVEVIGLTLDCDPPPFFQARITALDARAGTVTGTLMPGYIPSGTSGHRSVSYYRPDGSYISNGIIGGSWSRHPDSTQVEIQAPAPGVHVGDYLACVTRTGQQLRSIGCSGMRFTDMNIYAGGGMAVIEIGGPGGSVYTRVRCTRRPGTNRLHAFGADGYHFSGVGRGPTLDRCEGAYFADDEFNVHGQFGRIVNTLSPTRLRLTGTYFPGQTLDFWSFTELEPLGTAQVSHAVQTAGDDTWDVTLDHSLTLPADVLIDTHTQSATRYVVKNCWFHDTGQRYLINGAPDGITENTTFQNIGGSIDIGNESWNGYTEGAFPSGTIFKNNRLLNMAGGLNIILNPGGRPGHSLRRSTPIHNVTISENDFDGTRPIIDASQVEGLIIQDNVFNQPFADVPQADFGLIDEGFGDVMNAPIRLSSITNANISGNVVYDPQNRTHDCQVVLGPLTQKTIINGRAQWNAIADSLSSWYPEAQSGRGWSFGVISAAQAKASSYPVTVFVPLPVLENGAWKPEAGGNQYPFVAKTDQHPKTDQAVVRRWVSSISGSARVDGVTQTFDPGGSGTTVSVFVDGIRQGQIDCGDHLPHSFSLPLNSLHVGSPVDFVVDARQNADFDDTLFYAKIQVPPVVKEKYYR